jgi:hypothetical protein
MNRLPSLLPVPWRWAGLVLVAALLSPGCGQKKGDVSGTVTYQGRAVPVGTVTFLDAGNQAVGSSPISDGKYSLSKVPVGPVKVIVTTPPLPTQPVWLPPQARKPPPRDREMLTDRTPPNDPAARREPPVVLPAKYATPDESGLSFTVKPGRQEHPIELD